METIEAENRDAHPDLLRRVRGKTVAVDLSIWIFEATSQPELAEIFTPAGQVARLVFDRACNLLRHGVVPVGVLDGIPPPEKLRRLGLLTAAGAANRSAFASATSRRTTRAASVEPTRLAPTS